MTNGKLRERVRDLVHRGKHNKGDNDESNTIGKPNAHGLTLTDRSDSSSQVSNDNSISPAARAARAAYVNTLSPDQHYARTADAEDDSGLNEPKTLSSAETSLEVPGEAPGHQPSKAFDHLPPDSVIRDPKYHEDTEETVVHERIAPAVTDETIRRDVHEIRHEQIQRDIHDHHVIHKVQPIIVREVLPPRHFIIVDGEKQEVMEAEAKRHMAREAEVELEKRVQALNLANGHNPVEPFPSASEH